MATGTQDERRAGRIGLWLGTLGMAGLMALGLAYALTYEPAPRVRVLWHEDVTIPQRTALERKYLLSSGRDPIPQGSIAYDLLDTSRPNIKALVEDATIADTNDIDRDTYSVPFETDYGEEWMWIAHRTPGIRDVRVRTSVIVALVIMAVGGFALAVFRRRRSR
jgi:hypothetical protein